MLLTLLSSTSLSQVSLRIAIVVAKIQLTGIYKVYGVSLTNLRSKLAPKNLHHLLFLLLCRIRLLLCSGSFLFLCLYSRFEYICEIFGVELCVIVMERVSYENVRVTYEFMIPLLLYADLLLEYWFLIKKINLNFKFRLYDFA